MSRVLASLLALSLIAGPTAAAESASLSSKDKKLYRAAFVAVDKERWQEARRLAAQAKNPLPAKVIQWLDLARPGPGRAFEEYATFLVANPDWPDRATLLAQAERAMPDGLPTARIIAWFGPRPPATLEGATQLAQALTERRQAEQARQIARDGWVRLDGGEAGERKFLGSLASSLTPADHVARLDRLLWEEKDEAAKRMLPLVDAGHRALAIARLRLMQGTPGVDAALAKIPEALRGDPGLLYDRARWHRRSGNFPAAADLLDEFPAVPWREKLWPELEDAARRALDRGDISLAYRLASAHGTNAGTPFLEGEWLAGWVALRFLQEHQTALDHFQRLHKGATSSISKSRGAYWAGRAAEELGDKEQARQSYLAAAESLTAYYGQLAAHRLGRAEQVRFAAMPSPTGQETAAFEQRELVRAARLLGVLGRSDQAKPLVMHLQELARTPAESRLAADLAKDLNRDDVAHAVAKLARQRGGVEMIDHLFPLRRLPKGGPLEDPLILSVLRQESGFETDAVSPAGALGLMQLMPATARQVAKAIGVKYKKSRLTADADYNIRLGRAYLDQLVRQYGGSYVLALAAYNAGPTRVAEWRARHGDPRDPGVDVIDWVESIPLSETRNYVQRVMEGLQVYRQRVAKTQVALRLEQDLNRAAP